MIDLTKYGEPLLAVDYDQPAVVGEALLTISRLLRFWSILHGRKQKKRFKLGKLLQRESNLTQHLMSLSDTERDAILLIVNDICISQIKGFSPFAFMPGAEIVSQAAIKDRFINVLRISAPLMDGLKAQTLTPDTPSYVVRQALSALCAGELPELFRPAARRSRSNKPFTDWSFKLELYYMRKRLRAAGLSPKSVEELYSKGAGVSWDTASRWKDRAKRHLSESVQEQIKERIAAKVLNGRFANPSVAVNTMNELCDRYNAFRRDAP